MYSLYKNKMVECKRFSKNSKKADDYLQELESRKILDVTKTSIYISTK